MIDFHKSLRNPRLGFGFMIEVRDQALDDLAHIDIDVGLHRNIDRGAVMPSEASEAVEGLSQRIEPGRPRPPAILAAEPVSRSDRSDRAARDRRR
jgi:hypothetical protein